MSMSNPDEMRPPKVSRGERLRRIVAAIGANSTIRLNRLAEEFGVSTETIRRDLDKLSRQGLVSRTYGGAAAAPIGADPSFAERLESNAAARDAIALDAVTLARPGEVLLISSGVTSLQFAQRLAVAASDVTVVTTSLRVAAAVGGNPTIRVVLAPGDYDASEAAVFGPETHAFIARFHASTLFFGASGLTAEGVYESRSPVAWTLRAMIGQARRVVLLLDHTKFDSVHFERVCGLADLDVVVTDAAPDAALAEALDAAAVDLRIAPTP
jgi:DeoR/GlpR family transcriptional regulator of sugar metabolism